MVFNFFDRVRMHLQKSKNPQTHQNWFFVVCSRLVNWEGLNLLPRPQNQAKYFRKILPIITSTSCPSFPFNWNTIQRLCSKMYCKLFANTISKLIEWFKIWKFKCPKNETCLFQDKKQFLNCASKIAFSEIIL